MDFTTLEFIFVFLPIFLAVYLLSKQPWRLHVILAANGLFILASPYPKANLFWLSIVSIITYTTGLFIDINRQKGSIAKLAAWTGILSILFTLSAFKALAIGVGDRYTNLYFCEKLENLFLCNARGFIVPLGISYITFQSISYIIDVFKNQIPHEKNPIKFITYTLYFPKLISGPIVNYKNINKQLQVLGAGVDDIAAGLRRILVGIIKRILIANQVGIVANAVFNMPQSGITPKYAWLGLLAYSIQIYLDFSGYSDIAIGLARVMGIKLPENFNYPYIAQSITDFWRRWHITLSIWFREYIFFPLERKRFKFFGRQMNILIVFLLTGLWHGFNFNFIIWGLIHGVFIAFESTDGGRKWLNKISRPIRHIYTLVIVLTGWVFFRSPDTDFAFSFIGKLLGNTKNISQVPFSITTPLPFIEPTFILAISVGIISSIPFFSIFTILKEKFLKKPAAFMAYQIFQDVILILIFIVSIAAQLAGSFAPNIYARF